MTPPRTARLRKIHDEAQQLVRQLTARTAPRPSTPAPTASPAPSASPAPAVAITEADFDRAYAACDRHAHGCVSLVQLRKALPLPRAQFDHLLDSLRRQYRYSLSAADRAVSPEIEAAGIREGDRLLLFVSRRP